MLISLGQFINSRVTILNLPEHYTEKKIVYSDVKSNINSEPSPAVDT